MIKTISELLTQLKEKELEKIQKYHDVKHGPMIGEMYEGLTKDIINSGLDKEFLTKDIFKDIDLKVVSGKITNKEGKYSS
ncbi:hypothetical protein [Halanaerobium salsuginis]|uniref:Uncharacterized protein n=1 Tax=Halanaerobium salsuginis TaxID=29563 RepID=A0A1I4MP72_9FIRM|nr:hypothetical protein [Halanaerobium salsuginis]SFM05019.1 hypothetical protein SAMN02983006_02666 [Halanaerobium salsuginis]